MGITYNADAQVRKRTTSKKKTKEKTEQVSLLDKINPEIKFGNLGFFNGLAISTKVNAGFKVSNRFSFGAGGKLYYDQSSVVGPDPSITDLGGFLYGRAKITNEIYFQAEYALMKYGADPVGYNFRGLREDQKVNFPLVGLGYCSGLGKWRFGIELLYVTNELARDYQNSVVEYWFGASYNF
ncbi:MAG: hypothetical protein IPL55_05595 [Saprospiraceae bacterium]|nr:hypothetical protein [Saprospiraceae bacterium]MBL0026069.1 hypothetical protein [Saprospiraceae bacterium]